MTKTITALLSLLLLSTTGHLHAQVGGNVGFGQTGGLVRSEQNVRAQRVISKEDHPPTGTTTFLEASVLMNVKADEYVAVFATSADGETVAECSRKLDETLKTFIEDIKALGIAEDNLFVDFIAQNKIYGFAIEGDIAKEKLVGFELKKNVSIHYTDRILLDKVVAAAARSQIHDLVKVDYIVKDLTTIQDKLAETAARVLDQKKARYGKLLGIKLIPPMQIYAERSAIHYPTGRYDSYTAAESEAMNNGSVRQRYTVQQARKSRTFYFNGLDADGFDEVINPVITEPVVQFTFYLKVKYEVEQVKAQ
jgi:uncharacterized protein YggE